mmetsp:Transcript_21822/g.32667  ORF Transcript_21822/g.32667 Transcript_21822/m.32667 type:complete len:98 (+) Transcript_21822:394-687(+)
MSYAHTVLVILNAIQLAPFIGPGGGARIYHNILPSKWKKPDDGVAKITFVIAKDRQEIDRILMDDKRDPTELHDFISGKGFKTILAVEAEASEKTEL